MKRRIEAIRARWAFVATLIVLGSGAGPGQSAAPFEFKDGERVVLLGGTFIEREQEYGYLEAMLASRSPDRDLTVRNLGWSGDTVRGEARARFGTAAEGFAHLKEHVEALRPTVLIVSYGLNESFEGKPGLPAFGRDLATLMDVLDATGARVIVITPRRLETGPPPLPDPAPANDRLADYVAAIRADAERRHHRVVDLFDGWKPVPGRPLTDNGMHLTADGYRLAAPFIARSLGLPDDRGRLDADPARAARLRAAIVAKDRLYFHRWRPQNETYLFGFRKHEQGNNAAEIPGFDPLVAAREREIAQLRIPEVRPKPTP